MNIAKKRFGQHFVSCVELLNRIVSAAGDIEGYDVLEVGPGKGSLTQCILGRNPNSLVAIEFDKDLEKYHTGGGYKFLIGDALLVNERELVNKPVKIIANLPYNISVPLIFKWLEMGDFFSSITVMLQKEVAMRISAKVCSSDYGRLSIMSQLKSHIRWHFNVLPEFFNPKPKVDSAVITLTPYSEPMYEYKASSLDSLLRMLFNHRRKMIKASLRRYLSDVEELLMNNGIDPKKRPQELTIQELARLSLAYNFDT